MEEATLEILISEKEIQAKVDELAGKIWKDCLSREIKELYLIPLLKGAMLFHADLLRALGRVCNDKVVLYYEPMRVGSYNGTESKGDVKILLDVSTPLQGKHVLLVEDIIDTGLTLETLQKMMNARGVASLSTVALLDKKERRKPGCAARVDYTGFVIPNLFVVGYGLDHNERYRQLSHIAELKTGEK